MHERIVTSLKNIFKLRSDPEKKFKVKLFLLFIEQHLKLIYKLIHYLLHIYKLNISGNLVIQ